MNAPLLSLAASLMAEERPFAVATVVRREAPSSAHLGDSAIVTRDGALHGFIGGTCTRATVIEQALTVLQRGEPRLISFRDHEQARADDIVSVPMTCHSGGSVEIYIDPVFPAPRLLLLGASPVAHALARLGKAMGFVVHAGSVEDPEGLPQGVDKVLASLQGLGGLYARRETGTKLFVVVATMGESDEDMLLAALETEPDYLGVIASRRRMEEVRATLLHRGATADAVDAVHGPAGLDLGGTRPEEVAISVLAQIVASQRQGAPQHVSADAPARATAIDPVCGMTVPTDGSKPEARYGENTFYFCCGGCRTRFLAGPEEYVAVARADAPSSAGDQP